MDYDLNLKQKNGREKDRKAIAMRAIELGYHCIAWNIPCYGKLTNQIKPPSHVNITLADYNYCNQLRNVATISTTPSSSPRTQLRQFTRLTLNIEEINDAHGLSNNEIIRKFDILAVSTTNMKVFAYLCKSADIDIISLDFTQRLQFNMNKKLLDVAIARGIHFEIQYSPLIAGTNTRKKVMSSVPVLVHYLKGKHLIFSSGSDTSLHLRSPLDVSMLAQLLNIPIHKSRKTVSEYCAQVIKHSVARRARYLPMEVISSAEFQARWLECRLEEVQVDDNLICQLVATAADSDDESEEEEEVKEENDDGNDEEDENEDESDDKDEQEENSSPPDAKRKNDDEEVVEANEEEGNFVIDEQLDEIETKEPESGLGSLDFIQFSVGDGDEQGERDEKDQRISDFKFLKNMKSKKRSENVQDPLVEKKKKKLRQR